jgi:hypothetical protein
MRTRLWFRFRSSKRQKIERLRVVWPCSFAAATSLGVSASRLFCGKLTDNRIFKTLAKCEATTIFRAYNQVLNRHHLQNKNTQTQNTKMHLLWESWIYYLALPSFFFWFLAHLRSHIVKSSTPSFTREVLFSK